MDVNASNATRELQFRRAMKGPGRPASWNGTCSSSPAACGTDELEALGRRFEKEGKQSKRKPIDDKLSWGLSDGDVAEEEEVSASSAANPSHSRLHDVLTGRSAQTVRGPDPLQMCRPQFGCDLSDLPDDGRLQ
jgi:hypothetical protein